jgi:signal transduction histidine kinase
LSAITIEKARLHEQIVDAEEVLRQNERLSALGLLAAEVAHEIRNPLTVMKMLFHSMKLDFEPSDPRSKDAAIIQEKMEHMNKIVDHILDFARNAEPKLGEVDVNALVTDLALLVRHKVRNQGVQLKLELDPNIPRLNADRIQLEQAFLNLTLNALQAMTDRGTIIIATNLTFESTSNQSTQEPTIRIDFQDTGEGMTESQQKSLFNSLLASTKQGGTGLGMPLVSRVIHAHQGKLKVKSKPGSGTTISILIPVH